MRGRLFSGAILSLALFGGGSLAPAFAAPQPLAEPSTPEARSAVDRAAACLVENSPQVAADLLAMDFRMPAYRNKMEFLFDANRGCVKARWMRVNRLLIAGSLAEHLLEREKTPLNTRLARSAASSAAIPRGPSDATAFCVARSDPDGVGKLFGTTPGGQDETAAAEALTMAFGMCAKGKAVSISPAGLRSMIATASFRLLAGAQAAG